ncbi:hypothetical protein FDUTEX481_02927 [Tolypothrix sp. PCC 7601]|nr:hypothetical protein FDUTEX481_02927 [Tolypothrix sp. PCC 7601]
MLFASVCACFAKLTGAGQTYILCHFHWLRSAINSLRLLEKQIPCCRYLQEISIQSVYPTRDFTLIIP